MGHHINKDGQFQSDKYPVPPDMVMLSFHDRLARFPLAYLAAWYREKNPEFAEDIATRLNSVIAEERAARAENAGDPTEEEEEGEDSEPESKEES